ncbi:hypothetical protein LSH36_561g03089 [Paralvinella palmiformis]|uniref:CS domain-containing protein n=1 Tax=Paralvinella palmiformis TaxID=53620 RepID=A0AAD9J6D4_9ANNE|nr:hypothetical protein LSH36_561g03089 [Paralvinella palmiformis]
MAENNDASDADSKWPGVSVTDGNKYCILFLKVHNMKVKKKHGLFGVLVPCNADINVKFSKREVIVNVTVRDDDDNATVYEYKKSLPEEIDEVHSKWQIFKEDRIKIELCKAKSGSWERHVKILQKRE